MAKPYAIEFYSSTRWKRCREAYKKYKHYLCERCLAEGRFTPGDMVHHRIHLNEQNINDDSITLAFENLELLCREHHEQEHKRAAKDRGLRYWLDENGGVHPIEK